VDSNIFLVGCCTPTYSECRTSCMMWLVAVSCRIDFRSASSVGGPGHHVHRTWIPAIIFFGATLEIMCTSPTLTLFRNCKRNWSCCWSDHRWHVAWQLTASWFLYSESVRLKNSYWACSLWGPRAHTPYENDLPFKCHMLLYSRKLRIYCTSKLWRVFSISCM